MSYFLYCTAKFTEVLSFYTPGKCWKVLSYVLRQLLWAAFILHHLYTNQIQHKHNQCGKVAIERDNLKTHSSMDGLTTHWSHPITSFSAYSCQRSPEQYTNHMILRSPKLALLKSLEMHRKPSNQMLYVVNSAAHKVVVSVSRRISGVWTRCYPVTTRHCKLFVLFKCLKSIETLL